jgi:hypothetical protein
MIRLGKPFTSRSEDGAGAAVFGWIGGQIAKGKLSDVQFWVFRSSSSPTFEGDGWLKRH